MDKVSNHPFLDHKIFFATMHGKEEILAPLFDEIGMICVQGLIDTDQFGTFSGELKRKDSVLETLRKKIQAYSKINLDARFILASEGSFGPHPMIGCIQTDLESLLLWDKAASAEIYAEYLDIKPVHAEISLGPSDDYKKFLTEINFPHQGVIVHPENSFSTIYKGIHSEAALTHAMLDSFLNSASGRILIKPDLRACHSPHRREALFEAGKKLLEKLNSFCPCCRFPGFGIIQGLPGLKCSQCGEPSQIAKDVLLACIKCDYKEKRARPDGKLCLPPGECEFCNP